MGADSVAPFLLNNGDADFPGAVFFFAVQQTSASDKHGVFFRNKNQKIRTVRCQLKKRGFRIRILFGQGLKISCFGL